MSTETYETCPKCGEEIEFGVEYISADDGQWWSASMVATEDQPDCKCAFNDAEIDALEDQASNNYAESVNNYEP